MHQDNSRELTQQYCIEVDNCIVHKIMRLWYQMIYNFNIRYDDMICQNAYTQSFFYGEYVFVTFI